MEGLVKVHAKQATKSSTDIQQVVKMCLFGLIKSAQQHTAVNTRLSKHLQQSIYPFNPQRPETGIIYKKPLEWTLLFQRQFLKERKMLL